MTHLIIAIDGPASSGKGTLAKNLADRFDMAYLDTGLLYRKVGLEAYRAGVAEGDIAAATAVAQKIAQTLNWGDLLDPDLRGPQASRGASVFSAMAGVRSALTDIQRNFAQQPPAHMNGKPCRGVILDGRDIGTVICPQAPIKFFVTASAEVRAQRRVAYLTERGFAADYETILADLRDRDERDSNRAVAPLRAANDSQVIDTDHKSIDQVLAAAAQVVEAWFAQQAK